VQGKLGDATSSVQGGVSSLQSKASQAPGAAIQRTQGNPLAAGLVAFGLGWLFSSVAPATKVEERAAEQLADQAQQLKEPVTAHAKSLAQEVGDNLKGTAQEAAESVQTSAQLAAESVKSEAQSSTESVKGKAQGSAENVRSETSSS
jgi:hypothetical protein